MNSINDKTKYWLYSVSRDQWKIISNNIKLNKLFITTFICKSILKNDIIIFYIKVEAIYVAFGQVLNDIEKNTDNIILYNDRQLDKYIIKLKDMNISNNLCKKNDFIDIIDDYNKLIKKMIKNNCLFVEINIKNLGLEIMKKIYD